MHESGADPEYGIRTGVHSFGVVMVVTGPRPYEGAGLEIIVRIGSEERSPSRVLEDPAGLPGFPHTGRS